MDCLCCHLLGPSLVAGGAVIQSCVQSAQGFTRKQSVEKSASLVCVLFPVFRLNVDYTSLACSSCYCKTVLSYFVFFCVSSSSRTELFDYYLIPMNVECYHTHASFMMIIIISMAENVRISE